MYAIRQVILQSGVNKVRHNHKEIGDYFVHFMARGPVGENTVLHHILKTGILFLLLFDSHRIP